MAKKIRQNAQCTRCLKLNSIPLKEYRIGVGLTLFAVGGLLFVLIPILRPFAIALLIQGYNTGDQKRYCKDCKKEFITYKQEPTKHCLDCNKQVGYTPYSEELDCCIECGQFIGKST